MTRGFEVISETIPELEKLKTNTKRLALMMSGIYLIPASRTATTKGEAATNNKSKSHSLINSPKLKRGLTSTSLCFSGSKKQLIGIWNGHANSKDTAKVKDDNSPYGLLQCSRDGLAGILGLSEGNGN